MYLFAKNAPETLAWMFYYYVVFFKYMPQTSHDSSLSDSQGYPHRNFFRLVAVVDYVGF